MPRRRRPGGWRSSRRRGGSARSRDRSGRIRERRRPCRGRPGRVPTARRRGGGHGRPGRGPARSPRGGRGPGARARRAGRRRARSAHRAPARRGGAPRSRVSRQRGLADAGLAADQRQATLALERAPRRRQALLSSVRPTKTFVGSARPSGGSGGRPASAGSGSQTTLAAATGSGNPFRTSGPTGSMVGPSADCTSRRTASVTSTWPPAARSHRRLASTGGRPYQSPSTSSASPTAMPTRIASGVSPVAQIDTLLVATAHATAAEALGNVAITPSPALLTSVPPTRCSASSRSSR